MDDALFDSDDAVFDAEQFKAAVEQHRAEGWLHLEEDKKLFICSYIKAGYSIVPIVQRGCPQEEAEFYLRDPMVQAAIADVSERYAVINTFSTFGWRAKLARALDMALGEVPRLNKVGNELITAKVPDLATAARLLEIAVKYKDLKPDVGPMDFDQYPALPWEHRGSES